MGSYLYALIIYPIEMFIETVFSVSMQVIPSAGYAIVFVSIAVQALVLPIYKHADDLQEEERERQKKMEPDVSHIKKTFRGDERVMMLSTYYRVNGYHQYYQLRSILPLLLQIPFFIAAYHFLSGCSALEGASFYFLKDMGKPDGLFRIGGFAINVMPVLMTLINIVSGIIYTKGLPLKDKLQLYITAGVFLVLLYDSPSGLVFYWTLNNVFSLLKNVFMKLVKNPRPVITAGLVLFMSIYCYKAYAHNALETDSGRIVITVSAVVVLMLVYGLVKERFGNGKEEKKAVTPVTAEETAAFRISTVICTVALGVMIPAITVASSPTEFVVRGHYVNPLMQVLYSFFVAAGLFILWLNIIYNFYSERAKKILAHGMFIIAVCSLVNAQFFRQGLRNMSMNMLYYDGFGYDTAEKAVNLAVLALIAIVFVLLFKKAQKTLPVIGWALVGVAVFISLYNIVRIQSTLNSTAHIKDDDYYINSAACYDLDKNGKNVVVLFEDRAFGQFLPYILNEKPELEEVYSGFTYYKNTISFGTNTTTGSPALFGGYEYSAYNIKDKDDEFKNNCARVMPALFASEGYKTTVFDMPFYIDLDGNSIEDYYREADPRINAYYADGVVRTKEEAYRDHKYFENAARTNFIRHSVFLSSPLFLRRWIYDRGSYLTQTKAEDRITYAGHIEELDKLPDMARIGESGDNTFTIIENDAPHSMDINLQMPDYDLVDKADNSQYIEKWREKLDETPGGRPINMNTDLQIQAYEVNMSTILSIGRWLEYLKENDLYDNTRIIIVADHGYSFFAFDDMIMDVGDGNITDLGMFAPLLMVKDFADAPGAVSSEEKTVTSDEFMTNGDVPVLATAGLIEDPVNPYTGNPINDEQKKERKQYVFDDRIWLSVHDSIYDMDNWKVEDIK